MSALYRTYRPQDLSEVVGQRHVVRTLTNAIGADRVRHAYLFAGPRGTGKTSLAKILAKSLNCLNAERPTVTPCLRCESCVGIHDATALDVIELDAASNRGIDDIREIRERVAMRPVLGRRKVYILDEAHSLTTDASNALLKTLEEPPEHVVFVLCTTEPQRLLDTIKGRCQSFSFLRPGVEDLRAVLRRVAAAEGIEADEETLGLVARAARGSFRDAVSTLDQLSTATGGRIVPDDARALLGAVEEATLLAIVDQVVAGDTAAALRHVDALAEAGQDLGQLVTELLGHLRLLFLTHQLGEPPASAPVTEETRAAIVTQAATIDARTTLQFADGLLAVQAELREGGDPQLPLELLLIKLTRPSAERSTEAILRRLDALEAGTPAVASPIVTATPAGASLTDGPASPGALPPWEPDPGPPATVPLPSAMNGERAAERPVATPVAPVAPASSGARAVIDVPDEPAELRRLWVEQVLPLVRQRKESLASLLLDAEPLRVEGGALHVGYPAVRQLQRSWADSDANRPIVGEALSNVFGVRLRVVFHTLEGSSEAAPVPAAAAVPAIPSPDDHEAVREHEASFVADIRELFDAHEVTEEP